MPPCGCPAPVSYTHLDVYKRQAQKQEYEDKLEGLVLFDPMPFDGIENIDDLTLREAAVWGCIYNLSLIHI